MTEVRKHAEFKTHGYARETGAKLGKAAVREAARNKYSRSYVPIVDIANGQQNCNCYQNAVKTNLAMFGMALGNTAMNIFGSLITSAIYNHNEEDADTPEVTDTPPVSHAPVSHAPVQHTAESDTPQPNPVTEQQAKTSEEIVEGIIETANLDVEKDSDLFKDIVKKYEAMKAVNPNITDEEVTRRITNYTKALKFHQTEIRANAGEEVVYENPCSEATDVPSLIEKYKQFGAEYVELYDEDGNGSIDIDELFYRELYESYMILDHMSEHEAKTKALEMTEKYSKMSPQDLENDNSPEALLFTDVLNKISVIDTTEGAVQNGRISAEEAAAHLMSMAQLCDDKNNITMSEFNGAEFAIQYNGYTKEEIMEERGCDETTATQILKYVEQYNKNLKAYMPVYTQK